MPVIGKILTITAAAIFIGGTAALWTSYGGGVYAAYLTGMLMNCF